MGEKICIECLVKTRTMRDSSGQQVKSYRGGFESTREVFKSKGKNMDPCFNLVQVLTYIHTCSILMDHNTAA